MLLACSATPVDLGAVGGVPFCCVAGVGMDTPALKYVNSSRIRSRKLLYHLAAIRTLLCYESSRAQHQVNDATIQERVVLAVFSNTPTYCGRQSQLLQRPASSMRSSTTAYSSTSRGSTRLDVHAYEARPASRPSGVRSGVANAIRIDSAAPVRSPWMVN
jgi:diacylglycerol kinase family enzyme